MTLPTGFDKRDQMIGDNETEYKHWGVDTPPFLVLSYKYRGGGNNRYQILIVQPPQEVASRTTRNAYVHPSPEGRKRRPKERD